MSTIQPSADKFGVRRLYPSRLGGKEWYFGDKPLDEDPQLVYDFDQFVETSGGFFEPSSHASPRITIQVPTYQHASNTISHSVAATRGWLSTIEDWGPAVEFSFMCKMSKIEPNGSALHIEGPTGFHPSNAVSCSGAGYGCRIQFYTNPVKVSLYKEEYHQNRIEILEKDVTQLNFQFNSNDDPEAPHLPNGFGVKWCLFTKFGPDEEFVHMEQWLNGNGDKVTWIKAAEATDVNGWGTGSFEVCNGLETNVLNWRNGRMVIWYHADEADLKFKDISVREVSFSQSTIPITPPTTGPPPLPVGYFRRIYNIAYDMGTFQGNECGFEESVGEITEIYNVAQDSNSSNDQLDMTCHRAGIYANTPSSKLIGEKPVEVTWLMKRRGNPPSDRPLTCHIRRGSDDAIVATFDYLGGTLTPNLLDPDNYDPYIFRDTTSNYAMQQGDAVTIEWTGGLLEDADSVRVAENSNNPFDGIATCQRNFSIVDSNNKAVAWAEPDEDSDFAAVIKVKA